MKKTLLINIFLVASVWVHAQFHFAISHYTSDNGLSQNGITGMMKDHKGYLWIGTRDGLNKFDGYGFKTYNTHKNNLSELSNRILMFKEDKWGNIWVKTYDDIVFRLNPTTEETSRIEHPGGGLINDKIKDIIPQKSGRVWLTTENKGCYCAETDSDKQAVRAFLLSKEQHNLTDNNVNSVFEDNKNNTWILTNHGLTQLEGSTGKKSMRFIRNGFYASIENQKYIIFGSDNAIFLFDKRTSTFSTIPLEGSSKVSSIAEFNPNSYIIATSNNGFFCYDVLQNKVQHFNTAKNPQMHNNEILKIYIDRAGDAWMGIRAPGVLHYSARTNKLDYIQTSTNEGQISNPNFLILEDEKDVVWLQPYLGTFSWFDRNTNTLNPLASNYNQEINTLLSYGVNHVIADNQGVFWISTNRGNGFFKCTFLPDYFKHHLLNNQSIYSISNEIRAIFQDRQKQLWVASKDGSVHLYDQNKQLIGNLDKNGNISQNANIGVMVYNFFQDKSGDIWLSTKKSGLFRLKQYDHKKYKIENFVHNTNPYSPANNDFYSVTQDRHGRIWAGSYGGGLHLIDEKDGVVRFIHAANELKKYPIGNCSKVRQVFSDSKDNIWVASTEGIVVFGASFKNPSQIRYHYYHNTNGPNKGLSANDVHCIYEDYKGTIWIGTFGGGLNKISKPYQADKEPEFVVYDKKNGFPNNLVYTITGDHLGNLWITTENSIVRFTISNFESEAFGKGNELENVEFSEGSACRLASGDICVGSKSGFYSFNPESVNRHIVMAPLVFTRLLLFNKEVEVGSESILQKQLDLSPCIEFDHKQNVFTIEFASLDMRAPEKIKYAYKLDGFDADWTILQNSHNATYTSLPSGTYTFRVKSTDSEGVWLNNERTIEIKINPSFWQSWYARILYFLLLIGLFIGVLYIFTTIIKLKNNVELEKQVADIKLRFFTDISHELRTPITLISLPVDNILQEKLDPQIKEQLLLVRKNLDKVLGLINQILDFRKIQNNKMRLSVEEISIGDFCVNCCNNFNEVAISKNIQFRYQDDTNNANIWADYEQLDSMVTNLLSNAFKFTSTGKSITVRTFMRQNNIVLSVTDQGIGIAQEKINIIFERFFSNSTFRNITQKSTGIGLDLVKKLVDLHHAQIHVESQLGKGSVFEIEFLTGKKHFEDNADIIIAENSHINDQDGVIDEKSTDEEPENKDEQKPSILIVEDNDELRHFLKKALTKTHHVLEAENGLAGWLKTEQHLPDLVIADLLMPEMNGMELTRKIKEDTRTSHIPVIMLTAVTTMDTKLEAMRCGADEYITKPFSSEFLLARIDNLTLQRRQLQLYYRKQLSLPKPDFSLSPIEVKSQEDMFMTNLMKVLNENIDNFELNIDYLASELNMSRTVFFNKLKSLTGFSPVEFVREVRFERAGEYIKNTQLTVSEISYMVGIEDPRYFSRCFKQKFNMTPSEYRLHFQQKQE